MTKSTNLLNNPCKVTLYKCEDGKSYLSIECMNYSTEYELRDNPDINIAVSNLVCSSDKEMISSIFCSQVKKVYDTENRYHFDVIPVSFYSDKYDKCIITFNKLEYVINMINEGVYRVQSMTTEKIDIIDFNELPDYEMDLYCDNELLIDFNELPDYEMDLYCYNELLKLIQINETNSRMNFIQLHTNITHQNYAWLTIYNNEVNDSTFINDPDSNKYVKLIECIIPSKLFKDKLKEFGIFGYTLNVLDYTMELFINEEFRKFINDYIIDKNNTHLDINTRMITFSYINSNVVETHLLDNINY